jgi:hypothetical protein
VAETDFGKNPAAALARRNCTLDVGIRIIPSIVLYYHIVFENVTKQFSSSTVLLPPTGKLQMKIINAAGSRIKEEYRETR